MKSKKISKWIAPMFLLIVVLALGLLYLLLRVNIEKESEQAKNMEADFITELANFMNDMPGFNFSLYVQGDDHYYLGETFSKLYPDGNIYLEGYFGRNVVHFVIYPGTSNEDTESSTEVMIRKEGVYVKTSNWANLLGIDSHTYIRMPSGYVWIGAGASGEQIKEDILKAIQTSVYTVAATNDGDPALVIESFSLEKANFPSLEGIFNQYNGSLSTALVLSGEPMSRMLVIQGQGEVSFIFTLSEEPEVILRRPPTDVITEKTYNEEFQRYFPDNPFMITMK